MTRLHRPALAALAPWRVRVGGLWMGRVVSLVVSLVASLAPHAAAAQALPALQLLSPRPGEPATTTRDHVHVLDRTLPGATVRVAGEAVTVFATGVFARDRVPLQPGANTLVIEASLAKSKQNADNSPTIKRGLADIRRNVAVIRYHRALVWEKLGEQDKADADNRRVRELGCEPGPKLF